ncbi:MAG: molybdopterin-dependent oxidoreductase [Anaerolineaceae bacterium]|nr:molybdopterin-dependent oxidoreductase [Anaerolineaceae bacterium]
MAVVGKAVKRKEDPRLITGEARYLEDINLPGMTHIAILRSPHAHANIVSINTEAAAAVPGVVGVYTGQDFMDVNPLPCPWPAGGPDHPNNLNTPRALEVEKVTHIGAGVAVVVAEDRATAQDAVELIDVEWDVLPAVTDAEEATFEGAPQLHENAPNNVCMEWDCGDQEGADAALASSDVVVRQRLRNQRLIPNPMETRGCIAQHEPVNGEYTIWMTSQAPHVHRLLFTAFIFGVPENKVRVISPQIGGGFGAKIFMYPEYVLTTALSKTVGRPVKWVETRSENYIATTHGRDHVTDVEVGANRDGSITALKVKTYANLGGILSTVAPGIPTTLYGRMLSGAYRFPNIYCHVTGVYTNTGMVDAYRGAGRPEATYVVERAVDLVASELGMDPVEVRRKNFVPGDAFPFEPSNNLLNGLKYDSGDYDKALDMALDMTGYEDFRAEQAAARAEGRYLGIGFSTYIEICGIAPSSWMFGEGWGAGLWESANVRMHITGDVVVTTGSQSHGQGHETSVAQLVADELGVSMDQVHVQHSDTLGTPFGYGTYGSRSTAVGGVAVWRSLQRIKEKAKAIAAHEFEAAVEDVEYVVNEEGVGSVQVKGSPDQSKVVGEFMGIATSAAGGWSLPGDMEPFLDETSYYDPPDCTYPFGTHICIVEVDAETGGVDIKRYIAVDDVGKVINPMIVDGQVHGGIAQGVAQALWEGAQYDENGQLVSGSLMDYAIPRADLLPSFELGRTETPTPNNPLGVKGAGETGTIAATPAVVNAVVDALSHLDVRHIDMPLTPSRVWETIQSHSNGGNS